MTIYLGLTTKKVQYLLALSVIKFRFCLLQSLVGHGVPGAGGVDTAAEPSREDRSHEGEDHLGRVETHDTHSLLSLEADRQQAPGRGPRRRVVLLVRPRNPFPVPLHGHGLVFRSGGGI